MKRYISITYDNLVFSDSHQIIPGYLESHARNLNPADFKLVGELYDKNKRPMELLRRKGVYQMNV